MHRLVLAILFLSTAYAQDLNRTFQLKNSSAQGLQEIATTLRTVFDIKQLSIDPGVSTITVIGSADQIALTEWLIPKLDAPTQASQKYFYGGDTNDVVEVLPVKNASTVSNIQEILTTLRAVADIQKIYQSSVPRLLIMRSDPGHISMADFIAAQLDHPALPREKASVHAFQPNLTGNQLDKNDRVLVYGLANTPDVYKLQEILTTLRTVLQIQKIYQYTASKDLIIRADPNRIQAAEWLIPQLDDPASSSQKYFYGGNTNDIVEVLPLKNAPAVSNLQEILTTLRTVADIQKIYQSSVPKLLILRSDPGHIAMADFITAQLDQPVVARKNATVQAFRPNLPGSQLDKNDGVIVYGLANNPDVYKLQEILTTMRTVLQIQKIYQYTSSKNLIIRADPDKIQIAEWLIPKLDIASPSGIDNQMQYPGGKDDVVKVFYLPTGTNLGNLITSVRTAAKIPAMYQIMTPPAIVVRSTANQLLVVDKLIAGGL